MEKMDTMGVRGGRGGHWSAYGQLEGRDYARR